MRADPTIHAAPILTGALAGTTSTLRIRMADLLRIALFVLIVGHLGRIPLLSGAGKEAPVLLNDLMIVAVAAAAALIAARNRFLRLDTTARIALAFCAVGAVSAVLAVPRFGLSLYELAFSSAYLLRWLAYFTIYLAAINWLELRDVPRIWRTLEAMVVAFAGFGIFQSIFLPGFAQMVYPGSAGVTWDYQGRRLVSTFLDPNFAGAFIGLALLVQLALVMTGTRIHLWKLLLLGTALALTLSRSSVLAVLVGLLFLVAVWGVSRRVLQLGVAAAVVLSPVLPWIVGYGLTLNKFTVDASALGRVFSWLRALRIFADNPVLGVGFNTYGYVQRAYGMDVGGASAFGLDGGLLFIAVTTGIVGLTLYSAMLLGVVRRCRRIWRDARYSAEERGLALGAAAATVMLLVHSIFVNSLVYPFLMEALWILWALTSVIVRRFVDPAPDARERPAVSFHIVGSTT